MKKIYTLFILFCIALNSVAQIAVDPKGTKISVDSSKWKISGTNIYTKNTGNVGIGITSPDYKLDVSAAANPLRLTGVQNGNIITDSVLTIINGVVKKIATSTLNKNDSTTANNGITLTGKNVQLGGNLIQSTTINNNSNAFTIATGGSAFNITGLTAGASTDSILTVNTTTGKINRISPFANTTVSNTNTAPNSLTTTVNGVTGAAVPLVNSVSNTSTANTLRTTVNGVTGSNVNIINSNTLTQNGTNQLVSTINGISSTALTANITGDVTGNLGTSTVSKINGSPLGTTTGASNGQVLTWNGTAWAPATVSPTTTVSNTNNAPNSLTTTVNGVTGTAVAIVNSVSNNSSGNNLTTTVNGISGTTVPIVNSISNNLSGSTLTTTVNGVTGSSVNLAGIIPATTNNLSLSGNTLTSTVNGLSATSNSVGSVNNTSSGNNLTTTVNGVTGTTVPIVNSISNTSSANTLSTTVNGVTGASVPLVNSISNILSGNNLTTTVNGVASTPISLASITPATTHTLAISGNTLTSTVNGIAATSNSVSTVLNNSSANSLTTTVNGITGSSVNIINGNALGLSNGALTSTVNGISSTPVNVLNAASNGLTATNGTVQLGGTLSQATTIATSGNALNITGLSSGASTDSILTITNAGKVNWINRSSLTSGNYINNSTTQQASSNFNISGNGTIAGNLNLTGLQKGSILYMGSNGLVNGIQNNLYYDSTNKSVGIGTSSPIRALDVSQNSTNGLLKLQNTNANGYSSIDIWDNLGTQIGNVGYANNGATYSGSFYFATNTTKNMVFATNNTERVRIDGTTGNIGFGVTAPTASLHLKAGSAIANTAPLKFSSGTLLTAPETGAIEFDGTHFYGTISSNRYQLDQQKGMDSTTASNGLTLNGLNVQLGGNLTSNTTIGTGAYDLRITGLTAGASTDSILTINPTTGKINRINPASLSGAATNALNFINLASSFSSTTTTEANVTGWNFEVTAGKTYKVEVIGDFQTANTNTGVELGFYLTNSGAGTIRGFAAGDVSSSASASSLRKAISTIGSKDATNSFLVTTGVSQINTPHSINAVLTFTCTTSGTFNVGFASEVSSSTAQLNANSSLLWQQLN